MKLDDLLVSVEKGMEAATLASVCDVLSDQAMCWKLVDHVGARPEMECHHKVGQVSFVIGSSPQRWVMVLCHRLSTEKWELLGLGLKRDEVSKDFARRFFDRIAKNLAECQGATVETVLCAPGKVSPPQSRPSNN